MNRTVLALILCSAACSPVLDGNQQIVIGSAKIIPCLDVSGVASALLVVESRHECWQSVQGEHLSCDQRRDMVAQEPLVCSELIVVDSPSEMNLTAFITEPFDPLNMLAAATHSVLGLPCNPGGPFATNYDTFQDELVEFTGSVRITRDDGALGELEYDLQDADGVDAIVGSSPAEICR